MPVRSGLPANQLGWGDIQDIRAAMDKLQSRISGLAFVVADVNPRRTEQLSQCRLGKSLGTASGGQALAEIGCICEGRTSCHVGSINAISLRKGVIGVWACSH